MKEKMTMQRASEITGRAIKIQGNGYKHIVWETEKHTFSIHVGKDFDNNEEVMVLGEPKPWSKGSEVRKGRPRQIWVRNPSERYLRTLAI